MRFEYGLAEASLQSKTGLHYLRPSCRNCHGVLDFDGIRWLHVNSRHKHCPLASDVTLRPAKETEAEPG